MQVSRPIMIDTLKCSSHLEGVIVHSDQGGVYTSGAYQDLIKEKHVVASMS